MDNLTTFRDREVAFESVVRDYSLIITKVCYYFASDISELKDFRQEVLLNIWLGMEKFQMQSKLSTWIYRVCFNTCITYHRKNKQRKNEIPIPSVLEIEDEPFEIGKYEEMHRLIGRLASEDKAIILLWLDENSYDEIADIVGLKRNTVATRLKSIKEKLIKMSNE